MKVYKRKAQFYETDQMGIIHHASYINWLEEARVDFMDQMGYGYRKTTELGVDIALLGLGCEYKSMVRFGDTVDITASITAISPTRMTVSYAITDAEIGTLRSTAETRHCFFSNARQRPVALSREQPELYELLVRYSSPAAFGTRPSM